MPPVNVSPRISVVIPCYNAAKFIQQTVESVLKQTLSPCEILVIDDGSTDESGAIAASLSETVRVVHQKNSGECAARNRGLEEAKGEWIAFLDADDIWEPAKLELQMERLKQVSDAVCLHTGFYLFGSKEEKPEVPQAVVDREYTIESLLLNPLINSSTAMVKAGLPLRFPTWAKQGGDMLFFTEISRHGNFAYVAEPLAGYRMHAAQVTRNPEAWVEHFQNRFRWVTENEKWLSLERSKNLQQLLQQQVIEWLNLARWNRQWDRYWRLREYAQTLAWEGETPSALSQRLLPPIVYKMKDLFDRAFSSTRES